MSELLGDLRPRIGRLDLALTVLLSTLGLLLGDENYTGAPHASADLGGPHHLSVLVVPAFLLLTLPLLWRTSAPNLALVFVIVAHGLHEAAFGSVVRCGVAFPTIALLAYMTGARNTGTARRLGLVLVIAAAVIEGITDALSPGVLSVGLPLVLASYGVGILASRRAAMGVQLQEQTAELQRTRDESARLQVATDRADLSGELDALLQQRLHALAAMADAAGAPGARGDRAEVLADIERESRDTLDQMRHLVGALRGSDGAVATSPMPTLTSLEALVVRTRGPRSRVVIEGDPRVLPPGVELSAYRVVEHLLESLDDAPGVDVRVRFEADRLELNVQGQPRRRADVAGSLARARARVELHDGSLSSRTARGRSETTATLPMMQGA